MRKILVLALIATISFTFFQCSSNKKTPQVVSDEVSLADNDELSEKEDGIRLAQEHEFEITKDISLGYIPKDRLIRADDDLRIARMNGTYNNNRIEALTWTERGPNSDAIGGSNGNTRGTQTAPNAVTSGRMRAIWVDLSGSTIVWAGGVDGGLWKSTDITSAAAGVWSPVNDFLGNLAIASICQDPTNNNIMYFGTGEKTFNVDAVRGGGVWKSIDHGVTWALLGTTTGFTNVSRVLCDAAGNVYVATVAVGSALGSVQRSTDGGTSWTNITPTGLTSGCTEMRISSAGRLHVVCGYIGAGVSGYRFTDIPATVTTLTWTSPTTTFPTSENSELAVGGTGTTLYALPANASDLTPTIYKSTDGGANWAACATSPPSTASEPSINTGQGWYDLAIGVDPTNDNNVIAGGLNFYRTTNGGTSWTQITRWVGVALPYVHADHHTVVWTGASQVLVGTDGGIFYSGDGGTTWADRNDGLRLKQFYACAIHPSTTNYFLAGAQDNGVHLVNTAGIAASVEVTGGDGAFVHIDQDEPAYQFGSYVFNQYRRSTDGGTSWSSVNFSSSIGQFINPTDYDDIGNKMYAAGSAGQYVRWDNPQTGSTFNSVAVAALNSSTVNAVTVSPYTANRVFFGTLGGRVVRVDNANTGAPTGTNITQAGMSASAVSSIAVGTTDNNLLASFSNYGAIHIWVTTNGSTWTNITGTGLPDIPVRWAMFYPEDNTKAILATEMGIYETALINGASTVWAQSGSFPVVRTDMLQYRKSDGLVVAATHGRGLWSSTIPLSPMIRFAAGYSLKGEATATTSTCRNYTDYTVNMNIDAAPTGTATVTLSIAGGATATQGVDYDFTTNGSFAAPSSTLTFANGATTPQPITIRIYNDAEIESTESFTFNYAISGVTNATAAPSSASFPFTITDNDVAPVPGGSGTSTIGAGGFAGVNQPFRGNFEKARSQFIYLASELTAAGFSSGNITSLGFTITSKTSTLPYQGLTISLKNTLNSTFASVAFETGTTPVFGPVDYSTTSAPALNSFTITPFAWDGTSNLLVEICYDNTVGNLSGTGDVVSAHSTADDKGVWNRASAGTGCTLAAAFNQFSATFVRPDLSITASMTGNAIEAVLNNNRSEYVGNNGTYYFYTGGSGAIINSVTATSANLGCVSSNIFNSGNTWQAFLGGLRSQKVFEIIPTTNSGATYTVGLYFTAAELSAYSATPGTLRVAKTTAATMAAANSSNTVKVTPTFAAFGTGYVFTATFTGFSKFFLIDASVTLPVTLLSFNGHLDKKTIPLDWSTSQELSSSHFEIEKSTNGTDFRNIGRVAAAGVSVSQRHYNFIDRQVNEFNYYRLKMVDIDGRFVYSQTILVKNPDAAQEVWVVNNPFRSYIDVRFAKMPKQPVQLELINVAGARVYYKEFGINDQIRIDLSGIQLSKATYILRTRVDGKQYVNKVLKE